MNELRNKYHSDELEIVAINMDEYREDAEKFLTKHPALFTILTGNAETAKAFEIPGLPTAYLVNQQGVIMSRHIGFNKKSPEKTIKRINFLLANKWSKKQQYPYVFYYLLAAFQLLNPGKKVVSRKQRCN